MSLTWLRTLRDSGSVGLQVKLRVVIIEVLHLDGDGGARAQLPLRLLLRGDHHQQELPLVGVLKVEFLKHKLSLVLSLNAKFNQLSPVRCQIKGLKRHTHNFYPEQFQCNNSSEHIILR